MSPVFIALCIYAAASTLAALNAAALAPIAISAAAPTDSESSLWSQLQHMQLSN